MPSLCHAKNGFRFQMKRKNTRHPHLPIWNAQLPLMSWRIAKSIEGFPQGEDAAIQAMSIPPYYTACPNPFISQIVEAWQDQKEKQICGRTKKRLITASLSLTMSPRASKIRSTKFTLIIQRFPHALSLRYILHYTDPGDIVLDAFCGSGMTGVAAQLCGAIETIV